MPRPPNARGALAKHVSYAFVRHLLERPAPRAQRCQCGYWVREVPCAVCQVQEPRLRKERSDDPT